MYTVIFSSRFHKDLQKLAKRKPEYFEKVKNIVKILMDDPTRKSLRLHKLAGQNNWSVSLNRDIRMIFHYNKEEMYFTRIGTHDEVYI